MLSSLNGASDQDRERTITIARIIGLLEQAGEGTYKREILDRLTDDQLDQALKEALELPVAKPKEKQFQRVMYQTWDDMANDKLKPTDRLLFLAILKECWSKDRCRVWQSKLAREVGCDVRTIQRAEETLVSREWITIEHHHRDKSTYKIHPKRKHLLPPYPRKLTTIMSPNLDDTFVF